MSSQQQSPQDNRNLIIAVLICGLIFLGFDYYRMKTAPEIEPTMQTETIAQEGASDAAALAPQVAKEMAQQQQAVTEAQASRTLPVRASNYDGRVALKGGRIDELNLTHFFEDLEDKEEVHLFLPAGDKVFFFEAGWLGQNIESPNSETVWQASANKLTAAEPVTLTWENGQGLQFQRTYVLNPEDYTITVTDGVSNTGTAPQTLTHYAQLHKGATPEVTKDLQKQSTYTRYVGPEGFVGGEHTEVSYKDLMKKGPQSFTTRDGWVGISEQYFLGAIIPEQEEMDKKANFRYTNVRGKNYFSVDVQSEPMTVPAGEYRETTYRVFAGPKKISLLEEQGAKLDLAVDFGWYHIIAKMFFDILMWLYGLVGNLGLAVILLTIMIKIALWPLAAKSYVAMSKMKKLQPKMAQLKEKYGDDRQALGVEMMALYRQHKINPASGCWPMLIQIPIFFAFYKMILISFEFRHADFGLWIHDLSARDPYFILPIIMGLTMLIQQKLNPPAADPVQAQVMKMLPIIFTVMFAMFPAGLVLYWTTNSILSVAQQYFVMRRLGVEA
ncbi:MAG: membrane protein insertase YidC [Magnetococcales bacterium]|nr:membrane protein insertase YidC [Magnetococcales bacterium]|tara:strand:+ start:632194 stop:633858 length:1665 start_codon:yes stop_codon:yes gene_type:complete